MPIKLTVPALVAGVVLFAAQVSAQDADIAVVGEDTPDTLVFATLEGDWTTGGDAPSVLSVRDGRLGRSADGDTGDTRPIRLVPDCGEAPQPGLPHFRIGEGDDAPCYRLDAAPGNSLTYTQLPDGSVTTLYRVEP